jgi:hypothetical protein
MSTNTKKFTVYDSIFSDKVLKLLEPYTKLLPTDKSSYDVWDPQATMNKTLTESFTCDVLGKDRMEIINELFENPELPCYKKTWLKKCDIAIHKVPPTSLLKKHKDVCRFSLTVFLSSVEGGQFIWWDEEDNEYSVDPYPNKGIIACYDNFTQGAAHAVRPVISGIRYSLQLFVYPKDSNEVID